MTKKNTQLKELQNKPQGHTKKVHRLIYAGRSENVYFFGVALRFIL